jgi:HEAT repeat protein
MSEPDGSAAIDQALAQLGQREPEARVRAVRRLRVIGGPQAVAAIQGALDDPEEEVRARAAIALGQMEAREVVPSLIEQLKSSPSDEAREICVFALAQISDPRAVPPLIHALQDPSERVINQSSMTNRVPCELCAHGVCSSLAAKAWLTLCCRPWRTRFQES